MGNVRRLLLYVLMAVCATFAVSILINAYQAFANGVVTVNQRRYVWPADGFDYVFYVSRLGLYALALLLAAILCGIALRLTWLADRTKEVLDQVTGSRGEE